MPAVSIRYICENYEVPVTTAYWAAKKGYFGEGKFKITTNRAMEEWSVKTHYDLDQVDYWYHFIYKKNT